LREILDDDLLPVCRAARLAGMSDQRLRALILTSRGPAAFRGVGGEITVPRAEVEEWLAEREVPVRIRRPRSQTPRRDREWLPLEPLRRVMPVFSLAELARLAGVSTRTATRWSVVDEIPFYAGDEVACALGVHPFLVWGDGWWDESIRWDTDTDTDGGELLPGA
jgi:hypothetical protein